MRLLTLGMVLPLMFLCVTDFNRCNVFMACVFIVFFIAFIIFVILLCPFYCNICLESKIPPCGTIKLFNTLVAQKQHVSASGVIF